MSITVDTATEIRPFQAEIPQEEIDDMRRRLAAAREQPQIFSEEARATFRPLRRNGG